MYCAWHKKPNIVNKSVRRAAIVFCKKDQVAPRNKGQSVAELESIHSEQVDGDLMF